MKQLRTFLLLVALASCQKEVTEMKPAVSVDSATTATPVVEIVSFKPDAAQIKNVVSGNVRIFTLVLRVGGSAVDFEGITILFWDLWHVDAKRRVLSVDTLHFGGARIKSYYSLNYEPTFFSGLKYDWSAKPIKLGVGDHVITLKSDVELQAGQTEGRVSAFIEAYGFKMKNPQTGEYFRYIPSADPDNVPDLNNYIATGLLLVHPK